MSFNSKQLTIWTKETERIISIFEDFFEEQQFLLHAVAGEEIRFKNASFELVFCYNHSSYSWGKDMPFNSIKICKDGKTQWLSQLLQQSHPDLDILFFLEENRAKHISRLQGHYDLLIRYFEHIRKPEL